MITMEVFTKCLQWKKCLQSDYNGRVYKVFTICLQSVLSDKIYMSKRYDIVEHM